MYFDTLTQLELQIPPTVQENSWQRSQAFSTPRTQWNAYLNQICLETFLPWLQTEYAQAAAVWSSEMLPGVWELVDGTVITFEHKRLILLPSRSIDTSELRVPQEWIDIPDWAGDYYLAVQVNPDESWLRIWGYTTHEQLKTMGCYDPSDRTYSLDAPALIQDISILWVVQQLYADEPTQAAIAPLPNLSSTQAENLLQRLANPAIAQPRLEVPFELWGALLDSASWRQRLCQLRQGSTEPGLLVDTVTNLSQWLENTFSVGWQALENFLSSEELAFSLRQTTAVGESTVQRVKLLRLPNQSVLLVMALNTEADGRISIRVQLRPIERSLCLPPNLELSLLSAAGGTVQFLQSRPQDNSIQLQRFKCAPGTQFSVRVVLLNTVINENFAV